MRRLTNRSNSRYRYTFLTYIHLFMTKFMYYRATTFLIRRLISSTICFWRSIFFFHFIWRQQTTRRHWKSVKIERLRFPLFFHRRPFLRLWHRQKPIGKHLSIHFFTSPWTSIRFKLIRRPQICCGTSLMIILTLLTWIKKNKDIHKLYTLQISCDCPLFCFSLYWPKTSTI